MNILALVISLIIGVSNIFPSGEVFNEFKNTYSNGYYSKSYEIPEYLLENMYGKSIEKGNQVIDKLIAVDVTFRDFDESIKVGTLIVNKSLDKELQLIFKEIFHSGFKIYQIRPASYFSGNDAISMENNNSSAFNYRFIAGTKKLSNHSLGRAVDINPVQNPYISNGKVYPKEGSKYLERDLKVDGMITKDSEIVGIFKKYGWTWGGDWNNPKDYQHFEKKNKAVHSK
jgi:hypothetical protein